MTNRNELISHNIINLIVSGKDKKTSYYSISQKDIYDGEDHQIRIAGIGKNSVYSNLFDQISKESQKLGDVCSVLMGLVSRADKVSEKHFKIDTKLDAKKGDGIFILSNIEMKNLSLSAVEFSQYVRPFYKNSDVKKYYSESKNDYWILYIKDQGKPIKLPKGLEKHFEKYELLLTKLKKNFLKNKIAAEFVKKWLGNGNYFVLFNPKEEYYFTQPKIISPYRSSQNSFAYNEIPWFASQDVSYILLKDETYKLKYVLAFLNSNLCNFWLRKKGKIKGKVIEFYQKPLSNVPIKKISNDLQIKFIILVDYILILKSKELSNSEDKLIPLYFEQVIDGMVYEIYFPELLKQHNREILRHLIDLPPIMEKMSYTQKMIIIRGVFYRLNDKNHPVRINLSNLDSIPEIRIIEGKD